MPRSGLLLVALAIGLLVAPTGALHALSILEPYQYELTRLLAVAFAAMGLLMVTSDGSGRPGLDNAGRRGLAVSLALAVAFVFNGNPLLLLLTFSVLIGTVLNQTAKRLELVAERARRRML